MKSPTRRENEPLVVKAAKFTQALRRRVGNSGQHPAQHAVAQEYMVEDSCSRVQASEPHDDVAQCPVDFCE
nr:hypothetical protein [Mesorhizobium huakuii]